MRIKAIIVAYVFSVQYFENITIVAYAGLRVKWVSQSDYVVYLNLNLHQFVILKSCNKGYQATQVGSREKEDSYFSVLLYNISVIYTHPQSFLGLVW